MSHPGTSVQRRWAQFRFSIIGPLLAQPPEPGELEARLTELSHKTYKNPITGEAQCFGASTIERWYYAAKGQADPVSALCRKRPKHAGRHPSMSAGLCPPLEGQNRRAKSMANPLPHDNPCPPAKRQ